MIVKLKSAVMELLEDTVGYSLEEEEQSDSELDNETVSENSEEIHIKTLCVHHVNRHSSKIIEE